MAFSDDQLNSFSSFWKSTRINPITLNEFTAFKLVLFFLVSPILGFSQTYEFSNNLNVGGGIFTGTNEISTVYTEGTKDPLHLTMKEVGDLSCQGPTIYMTGGRLLILGCGVGNSNNYDKVFEIRKNNGDSFNAESVLISPSTYRTSSTAPYEPLLNVYIRGFKNNVQKGVIHLTNLVHAQNYPIDFSTYSGFEDIDMLYFFVDNQDLWVDNLTLSPLAQTPVLPTLSTLTASGVLSDQAVLGGNISDDGGAPITSRGIVWSTSTNPTLSSNRVNNGNGTGSFSATVSGLPATSTIYVRAFAVNSVGVAYGNQISFTTPSQLIAQILAITNESCSGNDGAVSLGAAGGTPPYTYLWLFDNSTLSSRNDLTAGSYTIRVSDSAGEIATAIVNLGAQDPLNLVLNLSQVSCSGGNDGSATVTASGGSGVYSYSWSVGGETGSQLGNLSAGNYSVTVSDQSGCQKVQNFTITEPAPLSAGVTSLTDVSCIGGNNGSVQISVSGGTPPYSYSWSPSNSNSPAIFDLSAGVYQVLVRDANFCEVSQTVTVKEPDLPLIVSTESVSEVLTSSARIFGSATVDLSGWGETESCIAKAGFVYDQAPNPDILSGSVVYVNPFSISGYSSLLQNLRPNTVYYVRAFVESSTGIVTYGNVQSFTTEALNLTIGGTFSVQSKTYDGNTEAQISFYGLVLSGLNPEFNKVGLENVVVEFESPEAGINKVVRIISANIAGPDAGRYNFTFLNAPVSSGTIFKKNLTLTGFSAATKIYDGTTHANVTGVPVLSGVLDGDEVIISGTPQFNFLTSNAGNNLEITVTGISLSGADASNYELFVPSLFADISKRQLEMEVPAINSSKVYDGTTLTVFSIGNPVNKVSGDDVTVTGLAQFEDPNVGTDKQIVLSYTISGNSAVNYFIPSPFVVSDGEITPAGLSVTVSSETKVFGNLDPLFSLTYSGFVSGDDSGVLTGIPLFTRELGEDVGNYAVGVTGLNASNYSLQFIAGNLEITRLRIQLTLPFLSKSYGDMDPVFTYQADPSIGTVLPNGTPVELNGSLIRQPGEDVGTYIIDIGTIKDLNPNYLIGYVGGLLSIIPKEVQVTADRISKQYGDLDPVLTYTAIPQVGEELANGLIVGFVGELERQPGEVVGNYIISKGTLSNPNFNFVFQNGELEITPLMLEVRANALSKVFGDLDPVLTFSTQPALGTVLSNGEVIRLSGDLMRRPGENAGKYLIEQGTLFSGNHSIAFYGTEFEILKREITITAERTSKIYGEIDPELIYVSSPAIASNLPNGELVSLEGRLARDPGEDIGIYGINQGSLSSPNFSIVFQGNEFQILPLKISISADKLSKTFGDLDPELTFSSFPVVGSGLSNGLKIEFSGGLQRELGENVGFYKITRGSLDNPNFEIGFEESELEIIPLSVRIKVDPIEKAFGDLDPELSFTSFPSLGATLPNGLSIEFQGNLIRVEGENVGTYKIEQGSLSNPNFNIEFEGDVLEIKPLSVTVTSDNISKSFGDLDPSLSFTSVPAIGSRLPNGIIVSFSGSLVRLPGESVGEYPINQGNLTNPNFKIDFEEGLFTISPLKVRVSAIPVEKVYGESDPQLRYISSPQLGEILPNGKVVSLKGQLARVAGENVGKYRILQGDLHGEDVQIEFVEADFSIIEKPLDIIPLPGQQKVYGDSDPQFTFQVVGLLSSDSNAVVSGSISREQGEDSGEYRFTLGNLSAGSNYRLILKEERFRIIPKALLVRAENKEKIYGDPNPELTLVLDGLVIGDTRIEQLPQISTPANLNSPVGLYPIVLNGGFAKNYTISLLDAELRILKRKVIVKADDLEMIYGDPVPELTFSYQGLVNGDVGLSESPEIQTTATSSSEVGAYPIRVSGAFDGNYEPEYQNGTLRILQRELQVIADSQTRKYGEPNPTLTYSLLGLVNGDLGLTSQPKLESPAELNSSVGAYPIVINGGIHPNYKLTYQNGVLNILPADLIITALNSGKVFGAEDPELVFTVAGFKNQDGTGLQKGSLGRVSGENVGVYPINLGSLNFGSNYSIQFTPASFEIQAVNLISISDPIEITTPWGIIPTLPPLVQALSQDGRVISLPVSWKNEQLNVFSRGIYLVGGGVNETAEIWNPQGLVPQIKVTVLPKPGPQDLILSNNRFIPDPTNFFQTIGSLKVLDPIDDQHTIELVAGFQDNSFFEIKDKFLFWSSADQASGKSQFTVKIKVTDRDGNTLEKDFLIIRERAELRTLEVYNSFSPNGDGVNDTWGVPDLRYYKNVRVHIFSREGRRVFYTENPDFRWDGTFKGIELATDTFQWIIEIAETGEKRNGVVHLFR